MPSFTDPPYLFVRVGSYIMWGEVAVLVGMPLLGQGGIDDGEVVLWGYSGHYIVRIGTLRLRNQEKEWVNVLLYK